jgi:hypothetical protein
MIKLHPQFLKKNGKDQFVVLSFKEFQAIQEALEDAGDLTALREAREKDDPSVPSLTLDDVKKRLGLSKNGRRSRHVSRKQK